MKQSPDFKKSLYLTLFLLSNSIKLFYKLNFD